MNRLHLVSGIRITVSPYYPHFIENTQRKKQNIHILIMKTDVLQT